MVIGHIWSRSSILPADKFIRERQCVTYTMTYASLFDKCNSTLLWFIVQLGIKESAQERRKLHYGLKVCEDSRSYTTPTVDPRAGIAISQSGIPHYFITAGSTGIAGFTYKRNNIMSNYEWDGASEMARNYFMTTSPTELAVSVL